jgi:hypothetical protein
MINLVYGGDDAFDAVVFGEQNPINTAYFQRQVQSVANTLNNAGQQFFSNVGEMFDRFNNSDVARIAKAAVRATKTLFMPNQICSIFDLGVMQQAPPVMQRWIMANPVVREAYHNQKCDGFSESYTDMSPKDIGENHYDYRRVMDGVIQEDNNGDSFVHFYMDDLVIGDRQLTHDDKTDVLSTWSIIEMFMKACKEDPTSVWNTSL